MVKQVSKRLTEDVEIYMTTLHEPVLQYAGDLKKYVGGTAVYIIYAVDYTPERLLKVLRDAAAMVDAGLGEGKLVLPGMGDYQVTYVTQNE